MKYWLVRVKPWGPGHCGSFSTEEDAELAKMIATKSWQTAEVVPDNEFKPYEGKL